MKERKLFHCERSFSSFFLRVSISSTCPSAAEAAEFKELFYCIIHITPRSGRFFCLSSGFSFFFLVLSIDQLLTFSDFQMRHTHFSSPLFVSEMKLNSSQELKHQWRQFRRRKKRPMDTQKVEECIHTRGAAP